MPELRVEFREGKEEADRGKDGGRKGGKESVVSI